MRRSTVKSFQHPDRHGGEIGPVPRQNPLIMRAERNLDRLNDMRRQSGGRL